MNHVLVFLFLFASTASTLINAFSLDEKVRLAIDTFNVEKASCSINKDLVDPKLIDLGEAIFNSKALSGDKDTSCSTCHLDNKALADGLNLAIGVGGEGEGTDRLNSDGIIVPRNTFTLFGRANINFQTFFWDGRIQKNGSEIISPIGEGFSKGFNSALAVAASMPIIARDEFLGVMKMFNNNENIHQVEDSYYQEKIPAIEAVLKSSLSNDRDKETLSLLKVINTAGYQISEISLPLIGNSLASFIATKVQKDCTESYWDKYLAGSPTSLTKKQKHGALLFYGKGRCAGCHNGSLFSDMGFHSIGVPQGKFGTHIGGSDIGRAQVTFNQKDRFKFRTPPLIQVNNTAPYGHNGIFKTLEEAVLFHINPLPFLTNSKNMNNEYKFSYGKLLASRSPILSYIEIEDDNEFKALIEFIKTL